MRIRCRSPRLAVTVGCLVALGLSASAAAERLVVRAQSLYSGSGPALANRIVVVEDGVIRSVARAEEFASAPEAVSYSAAVVTPGFIDAHTSVGLSGLFNVPADQDQDEISDPNQSELRALDAFNPDERLLHFLLEHGVTLVQTGPGPANPIAGQAGIFRTYGSVADSMVVRFPSALVVNLGERPKGTYRGRGKFPSTRMGTVALVRRALLDGREYLRKQREATGGGRKSRGGDDEKQAPDRDLQREVLARVADGQLPAILVADRSDDILSAIRIAREFNLRFALAGATEGYLVADAIRDSGAPVLVGPVSQRVGRPETMNASYENAAILDANGIRLAVRGGFEAYVPKSRLVLFEAAIAAANGLGPERAMHAITLGAAEILGVDDQYGSIDAGKVADLVLFDGDPFEYTSHVERVIMGGRVVYSRDQAAVSRP